MATQVKHRRGTDEEIAAGVPAIGEIWYNTTTGRIHMGDGVTTGGHAHARYSDVEALRVDLVAMGVDVTNLDAAVTSLSDDVTSLNLAVGVGPYGVVWNSEVDTYVRTGSSNVTQIQSNMKRCVLNDDGTVNYYLNPYNSEFKEDGVTASVLDGTDGNVMVQIPKFYVKYISEGTHRGVEISSVAAEGFSVHQAFIKDGVEVDFRYYRAYTGYVTGSILKSVSGVTPTRSQTIAVFRTQAELNGAGWHLTDWHLLQAVKILYLVEYADFNSQLYLGNGNHTGTDYGLTTGLSNGIGNASSGVSNSNTWMSYRGIENFYADCWEFIDGVNIQDRLVYVNSDYNTFASDVFIGDYVSTGITMPTASESYIGDINFGPGGFIPTATGGSSSTFVTDALWTATGNTTWQHGGTATAGLADGAFCSNANDVSSAASVSIGAAVSF